MTFDEDTAYNKSRKKPAKESEEAKAPRIHDTTMNKKLKKKIENLKKQKDISIHHRRIILRRGNMLGYERSSKIRKDMGFQKRISNKEIEPDPVPVM